MFFKNAQAPNDNLNSNAQLEGSWADTRRARSPVVRFGTTVDGQNPA